MALSVRELVQTCSYSCKSTALDNRATGKKGQEVALELGTYALVWSFSHSSQRSRSRSFVPMLVAAEPATTTPHTVPALRRGS